MTSLVPPLWLSSDENLKKKKKRKKKTKQKNPFHVLTWILGVILSVQLERKKKKTHPTRGQACFPVFCQHTASEVCEGERKRQLTLSTNLHFLFSCHLHAAQVLKTSISCYSPESQHQLQQDPSAQQSLLKSSANPKFIYLFIYFEKWKRGKEREGESTSARAGCKE